MSEEIVEYIKSQITGGFSEEQIKSAMKEQGWNDADIAKYIQQAKAEMAQPAQAQPSQTAEAQPSAPPQEQPLQQAPQSFSDKINGIIVKYKWPLIGGGAFIFLLVILIIAFSSCRGETPSLPADTTPGGTTPATPAEGGSDASQATPLTSGTATDTAKAYLEAYKGCNIEDVKKFYKPNEGPLKEGQNTLGWQFECEALSSAVSKTEVVEEKKLTETTAEVKVNFCTGEGTNHTCTLGVFNFESVNGQWLLINKASSTPEENQPAGNETQQGQTVTDDNQTEQQTVTNETAPTQNSTQGNITFPFG